MRRILRSNAGFSLLELLIASSIFAILLGTAGVLMTKPQRTVEEAGDRLYRAATADVALTDLGRTLARSYVMKSGLFACTGNAVTGARATVAPVTLSDDGARFSYAYSVTSTLVAVSSTSTGEVLAMDKGRFPNGALVLISHLNDSSFGGVFRVVASDADTGAVTLAQSDGVPPVAIGCQAAADANHSLESLVSDTTHKIFNQAPNTFRADVVRYASYRLSQPSAKSPLFTLNLDEWPLLTGNAGARPVMNDVIDFTVGQSWQSDGTVNGGTASFDYVVQRREIVTRASASLPNDQAPKRVLRGRVAYPLGGGLRTNYGAPDNNPSANVVYPTCALAATPVKGAFRRQKDPLDTSVVLQDIEPYRIEAVVSDTGGRLVTLHASATNDGDAEPTCWTAAQPANFDVSGRIPALVGEGSSAFALAPGGFVYCHLPPGSAVAGQMKYVDNDRGGKIVTVDCSGFNRSDGGTYAYAGAATTCSPDGTIRFGQLVDTTSGLPGPSLYVDETSCDWSDGTVAGSCRQDDTTKLVAPSRTLTKVHLRPADISIPGTLLEVACP